MEPIYEKDGVKIYRDDDPPNPRTDYDHVGTICCWHSRYALGDIPTEYPKEAFNTWEELEQTLIDDHGPCTVLPIYIYDHSGVTISTEPFSCPWDSGQVGFIYCSEARAIEEGIDDIEACLKAEVEEYDQYLRGECYGYVLEENEEEVHSCWGFYGYKPEQLAEAVLKGEA